MNITSPLPARQLDLSIDTESMVIEIADGQPHWIHTLIIETLGSNIVPLSNRSLRDLIKFLCPAEIPDHTKEVEWASRKIMQERLQVYIDTRVVKGKNTKAVPTTLSAPDSKFTSINPNGSRRRVKRSSRLKRRLRALGTG